YSEFILQEAPAGLPLYRPIPPIVAEPRPADIERFAAYLLAAKAPAIAAGKGVIRQGGTEALAELADRLQAPVVFPQDAIGVIADSHPFHAGHFGGIQPHPVCAAALARADLVFAIGLRTGTAEMAALTALVPPDRILMAEFADPAAAGEGVCVADPGLFLAALLAHLGNTHRPADPALAARIAAAGAEMRDGIAAQPATHHNDRPIYPGLVMQALDTVLDDSAILASDVGNCQMWARRYRRIATPESLMQSGAWNAMSFALPTALVAKLEFPARDVVALAGDGAFLMTIGDLPTLAEYGANILMLVLNNGAFGQTYMQQQELYGHTFGTTFTSPDFAAMARACGAEGVRVTDPGEVADALRDGLRATSHGP